MPFGFFEKEKVHTPMLIEEVRCKVSPHIRRDASCLDNPSRIQGLLNDCLRKHEIAKNLLLLGYNENICLEAQNCSELNKSTLKTCKKQLMDKHSLDETTATWIVVAWFCILERTVPVEFIEDLDARFSTESIEEEIKKHEADYSENGLWDKVSNNVKSIGAQLLYKAMQLYYATENPACPRKVKLTIYGALGYLIAPLDVVPDLMPMIGYTDDAAAVAAALVLAQSYIDDDVKFKAKSKLANLFGVNILSAIEE